MDVIADDDVDDNFGEIETEPEPVIEGLTRLVADSKLDLNGEIDTDGDAVIVVVFENALERVEFTDSDVVADTDKEMRDVTDKVGDNVSVDVGNIVFECVAVALVEVVGDNVADTVALVVVLCEPVGDLVPFRKEGDIVAETVDE